jgi:hypothetical protein
MEKNLTIHKNKNKKNKKMKWASLMIAGLMTLSSCSSTGSSKKGISEYEKTMEGRRTQEISKTEEKLPAAVDVSSKRKTNDDEVQTIKPNKEIVHNTDHMYDLENMERMRWRDYFKTGTFSYTIYFGKPGRKIEESKIEKDPFFSITELNNIRNPLNPMNLKRSDPLLYHFLDKQMNDYNEKNPENQKSMEDFILNYIRFFGFDILDKVKEGKIKFEKVNY